MRVIVFTRSNGNTSIRIPIRSINDPVELTDEEIEQRAVDSLPDNVTNIKLMKPNLIPEDRTFRDAWKNDLTVDIDKAKKITKDWLRSLRQPKLEALDIKFIRAQEEGTSTTEIVAEKKRLRDITKAVDQASTVEALKALTVDSVVSGK